MKQRVLVSPIDIIVSEAASECFSTFSFSAIPASVDSKTDQEVQDTIRREFVDRGVTVCTVAHRLDSVLGYDRIAVLGDGEVLEYGRPSELLKKQGGELRQLVEADRRNKQKGAKTKETPRDEESTLVSV